MAPLIKVMKFFKRALEKFFGHYLIDSVSSFYSEFKIFLMAFQKIQAQ